MQSQTIFFRLKTISPVHVGCDELYEPDGFVIDEENGELISFDPYSFVEMLDNDARNEFSDICQKGTIVSLIEIYRFMKRHKDLADGVRVGVSPDFVEHYRKTLKLTGEKNVQQNLNKYQIARTAFNPHSNAPYIPGSAIKGSLRTAILNFRNKGKSYPKYKGKGAGQKLEKQLTGGAFDNDPFRLVKVSDFMPVGEVKQRIVYGVNKKKEPSKFKAQGPPQIFEALEPGAEFIGSITIQSTSASVIKKPISSDEIKKALVLFFGAEKKKENRKLEAMSVPPVELSLSSNQVPLRLGRHSGAECITVAGHRQIKIMKGNGKSETKDQATTIWLASESKNSSTNKHLRPFGWVILEQLSVAEMAVFQKQAEKERRKLKKQQQEFLLGRKKKAVEQQASLAAEEKEHKQKFAEDHAAREKEKAAKEKWQNMPEEERDLAIIRGAEIAIANAPNLVLLKDVWPKIESASPEHRQALARAFMESWQAEGKWKVKKKNKKQFAKVQKVKEILYLF